MPIALPVQMGCGQPAQLVVDDRHHPVERRLALTIRHNRVLKDYIRPHAPVEVERSLARLARAARDLIASGARLAAFGRRELYISGSKYRSCRFITRSVPSLPQISSPYPKNSLPR